MLDYTIRPARAEDVPEIELLIAASTRQLSRGDYSEEEIEAAVTQIYGVDSELLADRSYFVAERNGTIIACGGWSKRKTLFGGDKFAGRQSGLLDPATDPAKIRAFFVHPDYARQGLGAAMLAHCESQAAQHGFRATELMSTLPGLKFYSVYGYFPGELVHYPVADGKTVRFVPMRKTL